jgi:hypothetical protein
VVTGQSDEDPTNRDAESGFRSSRWFTRGWTLQELLASSRTVFLDRHWGRSVPIYAMLSLPYPFRSWKMGISGVSVLQRKCHGLHGDRLRDQKIKHFMGIFGVVCRRFMGKEVRRRSCDFNKRSSKFRTIALFLPGLHLGEPKGLFARTPFELRMSGEVGASQSDVIGDKSSYSFANIGFAHSSSPHPCVFQLRLHRSKKLLCIVNLRREEWTICLRLFTKDSGSQAFLLPPMYQA